MKSSRPLSQSIAQIAAGCALSGGFLSLAGMLWWWSGRWHETAFTTNQVPMAPSTALLMLLLSVAAYLRTKPRANRGTRIAEAACGLAVIMFATLLGLSAFVEFAGPVESWLSGTSETLGKFSLGRMSPWTAGTFVLGAGALLCAQASESFWRPLRSMGGWLGLTVLFVGGAVVAGYVARTPFLYGGAYIPMARLTGGTFAFLGAAILLGGGSEAWPLRMVLRGPSDSDGRATYQVQWSLLLLFVGLASGITVVGLFFLNRRQAEARDAARAELEAIADLKAQQLVNWRQERLLDGRFFSQSPFVARDVLRLLDAPSDKSVVSEVKRWLTLLKADERYERVTLYDSQLNPLVSVPDRIGALSAAERSELAGALDADHVLLNDLHRHDPSTGIHLDLFVPIFLPGASNSIDAKLLNRTEPPIAVLHLQINPITFLYPLVQSWPTPSPSAETLLIRREGNSVLYLNNLRHQPGTGMILRRPLKDPRLLEAIALREENRVCEGLDYRGVPVVAAVRAVPDTTWVMVAKVDEAELYAPVRRQALAAGAVTLALVCASTLGVTALSQRRSEQLLAAQLVAERERRILAERFEHLMKHANDAVLLVDARGHILEVNDRALQTYGWTHAELKNLTLPDLRSPGSRPGFPDQVQTMHECGQALFETEHRRKDGTCFPVEVSANLVHIDGHPVELAIVRDITRRKAEEAQRRQAEEALRRQAEELRLRNEDLTRFNRATVDRELRMIELKKLVNELSRRLQRPPPFALDFIDDPPMTHDSRVAPADTPGDRS